MLPDDPTEPSAKTPKTSGFEVIKIKKGLAIYKQSRSPFWYVRCYMPFGGRFIPALVEETFSLIQLNTPSDITVSGDTAQAQCSIRETGINASVRFEAHGWYDDELVRLDGQWKFARRTFNLIENYFTPVSSLHEQD
jgi:hypothetical protein